MSIPYSPPHQAPPQIVVQPFASSPSSGFPLPPGAAPPAPQLSTYAPSSHPPHMAQVQRGPSPTSALPPVPQTHVPSPPAPAAMTLPAYDQGDWRSAAEQEKDAYHARGSDDGHWADVPSHVGEGGRKGAPPAILLPPPKAAFASAPNSPMSLKMAEQFGDVSSVKEGKVGGRGAAEVRKSGLDWARFSMMVKQREAEKKSDWLSRKKKTSKKWFWLGWTGTAVVIIIIIAVVVALVSRKKGEDDGVPKTPSLGGLNEKNVSSVVSFVSHSGDASSAILASSSTQSSLLHALSSTTAVTAETTTARAQLVEAEESSSTAAVRQTTTTAAAARTSSSSSASTARRSTTAETTTATSTTASTTSATTTTTVRASRATSTSSAANGEDEEEETRRLAKRFGSWAGIEWKQPGYVPDARRTKRDGGNWREIDFTSPHASHRVKKRAQH
ncbi:hypothetical protein JCM11251_007378 [Rhodosporidiobolus azoricus]